MLLWVWTLFLPGILWAQTPLYFDEIGCGARAIAMGQAYTAVAQGPEAAYYNPAGLTQLPTHFAATFGYQYCNTIPWMLRRDFCYFYYFNAYSLSANEAFRCRPCSFRSLFYLESADWNNYSTLRPFPLHSHRHIRGPF